MAEVCAGQNGFKYCKDINENLFENDSWGDRLETTLHHGARIAGRSKLTGLAAQHMKEWQP